MKALLQTADEADEMQLLLDRCESVVLWAYHDGASESRTIPEPLKPLLDDIQKFTKVQR